MKIPIPEDWNGTSWSRFSICWPASPAWEALLLGFITTPKRGRFWDERSGIVIEAQAIGEEIFARNYPFEEVFMSCSEGQMVAKAILYHAAVTGGLVIYPFPVELTDAFFETVDFRHNGLGNKIGPNTNEHEPRTIQATLEALKLAIDELKEITANTPQGKDLEPVLNAIEDVLGGDWDPPSPE